MAVYTKINQKEVNIINKNFDIKIQKPINDELHEVFNSLDEVRENFKKEESAKKQLADINKKIAMENLSKNHFFSLGRSPVWRLPCRYRTLPIPPEWICLMVVTRDG